MGKHLVKHNLKGQELDSMAYFIRYGSRSATKLAAPIAPLSLVARLLGFSETHVSSFIKRHSKKLEE